MLYYPKRKLPKLKQLKHRSNAEKTASLQLYCVSKCAHHNDRVVARNYNGKALEEDDALAVNVCALSNAPSMVADVLKKSIRIVVVLCGVADPEVGRQLLMHQHGIQLSH